jgi:hypothetical protein
MSSSRRTKGKFGTMHSSSLPSEIDFFSCTKKFHEISEGKAVEIVDAAQTKVREAAVAKTYDAVHAASTGKEIKEKEKKQLRQDRDGSIMIPLWAIKQVLVVSKDLKRNIDDDYLEKLSEKVNELHFCNLEKPCEKTNDDTTQVDLDSFLKVLMDVVEEQAERDTVVSYILIKPFVFIN